MFLQLNGLFLNGGRSRNYRSLSDLLEPVRRIDYYNFNPVFWLDSFSSTVVDVPGNLGSGIVDRRNLYCNLFQIFKARDFCDGSCIRIGVYEQMFGAHDLKFYARA